MFSRAAAITALAAKRRELGLANVEGRGEDRKGARTVAGEGRRTADSMRNLSLNADLTNDLAVSMFHEGGIVRKEGRRRGGEGPAASLQFRHPPSSAESRRAGQGRAGLDPAAPCSLTHLLAALPASL